MRSHSYRWVILAAAFAVNATIQLLWVAYVPVTLDAQRFYGVGTTAVGMFSMLFMLAFIPFSLPASWLIDRYGVRRAVGWASVAVGIGGVLRGLAGDSFGLALAATALPAVAQPVLLNSWTAIVHPWFGEGRRTTAVGVITLGNLLGTAVGLVATPGLLGSWSLAAIQLGYGVIALVAGVAFVVLVRDRPRAGGDVFPGEPLGVVVRETAALATRPPMPRLLLMALVAYGTFNGVTTWLDPIVEPKGFDADAAGLLGGVMLLGGLVGAVVVSEICDRTGRRAAALAVCFAVAAAALLVLALSAAASVMFAAAAVFGAFLVSSMPVAIEYVTELAAPTSPAVANGLVQLVGQASVVVVFATGALGEAVGSFLPVLYVGVLSLAPAAVAAALMARRPREATAPR